MTNSNYRDPTFQQTRWNLNNENKMSATYVLHLVDLKQFLHQKACFWKIEIILAFLSLTRAASNAVKKRVDNHYT